MRYRRHISLALLLLTDTILAFGQPAAVGPDADLSLYYEWQEREGRDSVYLKAYQRYQVEKAAGTTGDTAKNSNAIGKSSPSKTKREAARELEELSALFTEEFWVEKDYDQAFYIGFQLEEKLPQVSESEYPGKRKDYFKLGEAYYRFLDNYKSIELLEEALSPVPLSFEDQTNLDALKIIGICYANIADWQRSDDYFRATLLSGDIVLDRPLYNAFAISHLGCNAMLTGRYDLALRLSAAVWPTLRETDDYGHLAGMCYCRGRSYLEKGDFKQASKWVDSLAYFARKDTYNQTKRIKQAYSLQADYYTVLGDARQAKVYNDSLVGIYKTSEQDYTSQYIARTAQEYNNDKLSAQAAELKISRARGIIIAVVALLSIAVALVIASLYRKKNAAYKALARKAEEWSRSSESLPVLISVDKTDATNRAELPTKEEGRIMSLVEEEMTGKHAYREAGITADALADRLGVHRNSLSRVINSATGSNFSQYVNGYRIREAVRSLSESGDGKVYIDELSERVGFANHTSFYRAFKQFTGLSPAEFRKNRDAELKNIDF